MTKEIAEKVVYMVGDFSFDTRAEAQAHIRYVAAHTNVMTSLEASNIYFRDTSADEVAEWIVRNFEQLKVLIGGAA